MFGVKHGIKLYLCICRETSPTLLFTVLLLTLCQLKMHEVYKSFHLGPLHFTPILFTQNFFDGSRVESLFRGEFSSAVLMA